MCTTIQSGLEVYPRACNCSMVAMFSKVPCPCDEVGVGSVVCGGSFVDVNSGSASRWNAVVLSSFAKSSICCCDICNECNSGG